MFFFEKKWNIFKDIIFVVFVSLSIGCSDELDSPGEVNDATPSVPSTPDIPSVPGTPTIPDVPSVPSTPDIPSVPGIPSIPDVPSVPSTPDIPSVPGVPGSIELRLKGKSISEDNPLFDNSIITIKPSKNIELPFLLKIGSQTAEIHANTIDVSHWSSSISDEDKITVCSDASFTICSETFDFYKESNALTSDEYHYLYEFTHLSVNDSNKLAVIDTTTEDISQEIQTRTRAKLEDSFNINEVNVSNTGNEIVIDNLTPRTFSSIALYSEGDFYTLNIDIPPFSKVVSKVNHTFKASSLMFIEPSPLFSLTADYIDPKDDVFSGCNQKEGDCADAFGHKIFNDFTAKKAVYNNVMIRLKQVFNDKVFFNTVIRNIDLYYKDGSRYFNEYDETGFTWFRTVYPYRYPVRLLGSTYPDKKDSSGNTIKGLTEDNFENCNDYVKGELLKYTGYAYWPDVKPKTIKAYTVMNPYYVGVPSQLFGDALDSWSLTCGYFKYMSDPLSQSGLMSMYWTFFHELQHTRGDQHNFHWDWPVTDNLRLTNEGIDCNQPEHKNNAKLCPSGVAKTQVGATYTIHEFLKQKHGNGELDSLLDELKEERNQVNISINELSRNVYTLKLTSEYQDIDNLKLHFFTGYRKYLHSSNPDKQVRELNTHYKNFASQPIRVYRNSSDEFILIFENGVPGDGVSVSIDSNVSERLSSTFIEAKDLDDEWWHDEWWQGAEPISSQSLGSNDHIPVVD